MAVQTQTRRTRTDSRARWQSALDRAITNALDVYVSTDGSAFVESASTPGLLYAVSREGCTCPAGEKGMICQHRACYLAQIGELSLDPEPEPVAPAICPVCDGDRVIYDPIALKYGGWNPKCTACQGTGRMAA